MSECAVWIWDTEIALVEFVGAALPQRKLHLEVQGKKPFLSNKSEVRRSSNPRAGLIYIITNIKVILIFEVSLLHENNPSLNLEPHRHTGHADLYPDLYQTSIHPNKGV